MIVVGLGFKAGEAIQLRGRGDQEQRRIRPYVKPSQALSHHVAAEPISIRESAIAEELAG